MLGRTHQLIGISSGLATYLLLFPNEYAPATLGASLVGAHFGALLPDLDQPAAKIWQSFPGGPIVGEIVDPFLKHRNLTHSLLGFALIGLLLSKIQEYLPSYWGIIPDRALVVTMVAYSSHLLADAVTVEGIPLFFPYPRRFGFPPFPLAGLRIQTGQWFENLIIFPLVNLLFLALAYSQWPMIRQILFRN